MELLNFINSNSNWEEILSAPPYNIKVSRDESYILFKYNQLDSDFSIPLVRECRGCIVRRDYFGQYHCVCHPFDKFGNYGESYAPELNGDLTVLEKVDGSLIKCWWDLDEFYISTNGTIDAYNAPVGDGLVYESFGELVEVAVARAGMNWGQFMETCKRGYTWMFELVSPYTRIVVPYEETELYVLGRRNMETELEEDPYQFESELFNYFKKPEKYEIHSLKDVIDVSERLQWDTEGFVVHDEVFNRVKVKSPEYIKAHYMRVNGVITRRRLIGIWLMGEQEEFLTYCEDFRPHMGHLEDDLDMIEKQSEEEKEYICFLTATRRDLADHINVACAPYTRNFLFYCLDHPDTKWRDWIRTKNINFVEKLLDSYHTYILTEGE